MRNLLPPAHAFQHIAAFYKHRSEHSYDGNLLRLMVRHQDLYRKLSFGVFG